MLDKPHEGFYWIRYRHPDGDFDVTLSYFNGRDWEQTGTTELINHADVVFISPQVTAPKGL